MEDFEDNKKKVLEVLEGLTDTEKKLLLVDVLSEIEEERFASLLVEKIKAETDKE